MSNFSQFATLAADYTKEAHLVFAIDRKLVQNSLVHEFLLFIMAGLHTKKQFLVKAVVQPLEMLSSLLFQLN